jgi:hypothetical protein
MRYLMSMGRAKVLMLNASQRSALEAIVARPLEAAGHVRRARVILLSADGVTGREIADRLGLKLRALIMPAATS